MEGRQKLDRELEPIRQAWFEARKKGQADSRPCGTGGTTASWNAFPSLASMRGTGSGTDWGWAYGHQGPSKQG